MPRRCVRSGGDLFAACAFPAGGRSFLSSRSLLGHENFPFVTVPIVLWFRKLLSPVIVGRLELGIEFFSKIIILSSKSFKSEGLYVQSFVITILFAPLFSLGKNEKTFFNSFTSFLVVDSLCNRVSPCIESLDRVSRSRGSISRYRSLRRDTGTTCISSSIRIV